MAGAEGHTMLVVMRWLCFAGVYSCAGSTWCSSAVQSEQAHASPAWFFHRRKLTDVHGWHTYQLTLVYLSCYWYVVN